MVSAQARELVKDKEKEYQKEYRRKHRAEKLAYGEAYRRKHRARLNTFQRERSRRIKPDVLGHYSSGVPTCAACGVNDLRVLSIDHKDGGGHKHRQDIGKYGTAFYTWLQEQNYPLGYQVLCMNCQFIKKYTRGER